MLLSPGTEPSRNVIRAMEAKLPKTSSEPETAADKSITLRSPEALLRAVRKRRIEILGRQIQVVAKRAKHSLAVNSKLR